MKVKVKSPPKKNGTDVLSMLKLVKDKDTVAYAGKMSNLLNFLYATNDIRIGAEVVEAGIIISQSGHIKSYEELRERHIENEINDIVFHHPDIIKINEEEKEEWSAVSELRMAWKKKRKGKAKDELQAEVEEKSEIVRLADAERDKRKEKIIEEESEKIRAAEYTLQFLQEKFMLFTGVKIRIDLQTGSYTFPVPTGTPFYNEVCNVLGLPLENQEVKVKPVVKRMFTMQPEVLQAINNALKFVSTDDLRPAMTCINLEINDNKMVVIATDAHRLYKSREFEVSGPPGTYNYLLPRKQIKSLLKGNDEPFILYELKDNKVGLLGTTIDLFTEGRYPDWKVVMPKYESGVVFDRKEMLESVKEVAVYSNKSTKQVCFDFNGEILLSAQYVDFSFESNKRMRYLSKTMPDIIIAFNGQFFAECLTVFSCNEITFQAEAPTKAGILTDGMDTVLLMPLMLNK